jgi:hypothetical protein
VEEVEGEEMAEGLFVGIKGEIGRPTDSVHGCSPVLMLLLVLAGCCWSLLLLLLLLLLL